VAVVVWLEDDLAVVVEDESAAVDCVTTEGLVGAELAEYMTLNDDWEEAEAVGVLWGLCCVWRCNRDCQEYPKQRLLGDVGLGWR